MSEKQFTRFLCDSPLIPKKGAPPPRLALRLRLVPPALPSRWEARCRGHRYYRLRTRDWKHDDVTHRQQYISWRNDWCNPCRLALWASTRVCVGAVASERRRNHRSMIEECYQQLSMASAAVWQRFSVDKVASRCFLPCFCMLRHCALYKTRFGTVSRLSWTWLPKTEPYGQAVVSLHWDSYFLKTWQL